MATLYVFDIDDTLFNTTARTIVRSSQGEILHHLNTEEVYAYTLKDGETFDFEEFVDAEKFNRSEPIAKMVENFRRIQNKIDLNLVPGSKIMVNTARGWFDDLDKFLDTFKKHGMHVHIDNVHRAALIKGSLSPAQKKLIGIRRHLESGNFDTVIMYDDSPTNLKAFLTLKAEYPDKRFHGFLVDEDGDYSDFVHRAEKPELRVCPYCRTEIVNEETYWEDHDTCDND